MQTEIIHLYVARLITEKNVATYFLTVDTTEIPGEIIGCYKIDCDIDTIVKKYMKRYGVDNVRGGTFVGKLSEKQTYELLNDNTDDYDLEFFDDIINPLSQEFRRDHINKKIKDLLAIQEKKHRIQTAINKTNHINLKFIDDVEKYDECIKQINDLDHTFHLASNANLANFFVWQDAQIKMTNATSKIYDKKLESKKYLENINIVQRVYDEFLKLSNNTIKQTNVKLMIYQIVDFNLEKKKELELIKITDDQIEKELISLYSEKIQLNK